MRITHSIGRPTRALFLGSLVALTAAPSFGRPGDRIGRYPLLVRGPSAEVIGPSLAMEESGRFVAVWASDEGQDTHVVFQRFAANGTPIGAEVRVGTASDPNDDSWVRTDVALAADGSFAVVWSDCAFPCQASALYARRYTAIGEPIGDEVVVMRPAQRAHRRLGRRSCSGRPIRDRVAGAVRLGGPGAISTFGRRCRRAAVTAVSRRVGADARTVLPRGIAVARRGMWWLRRQHHSDSLQLLLGRRFDANGSRSAHFHARSKTATTPRSAVPFSRCARPANSCWP